ncbi:YjcG family protein [Macrococcoides caseolyticum]|uniref:YjcG family protein n=1 Tax=Macrococcoides caseolyticum TaxID=69966 RepID=UPI001F17B9A1|nr:YjcG family protein [Macrococcus caseolyticus]MCE4955715.1 YjcG family protein [Macrococcus caseolyticus]
MKLGIVLYPSKAYQDEINKYRKRYDAHYAFITPHITIKEAFEVSEDALKEVTDYLSTVAQNVQPVEINVEKVSDFAPTQNVIYLKVTPNDNLVKLHELLNDGTFYGHNTYPFVPHFTIAQGLTSQEFEDVKGQLSMTNVHHTEIIDTLSLCYQLENGTWNVKETFRLG